MSRKALATSDIFDFPVKLVELQTPEGKASGFHGVLREDSGSVLGAFSGAYGLIKNAQLVDEVEKVFKKNGMANFDRKTVVTRNGSRFFSQYDFKDKLATIQNANVGDVVGFRLTLNNSYDGSCVAGFSCGAIRLACKNGATVGDKDIVFGKKHFTSLSFEKMEIALNQAAATFDRSVGIFQLMGNRQITAEEGSNIIDNLEKSDLISRRMREDIKILWLNPTRPEDQPRTVFNVYNAVTEYLTHTLETERFEYSMLLGEKIGRAFTQMMLFTSKLDKAIKKVSK